MRGGEEQCHLQSTFGACSSDQKSSLKFSTYSGSKVVVLSVCTHFGSREPRQHEGEAVNAKILTLPDASHKSRLEYGLASGGTSQSLSSKTLVLFRQKPRGRTKASCGWVESLNDILAANPLGREG
jgi:ABC-type hemin transport system ATPase subunit